MNASQTKIASTWFIGSATLFAVFGISDLLPIHSSITLIVGFSLCAFLRRNIPKENNNVFQIMRIKSLPASIIYFSVLVISVVWVFLNYPDELYDNPYTQTVIFIFVIAPFTPNQIRHEYNLFKMAGIKNA